MGTSTCPVLAPLKRRKRRRRYSITEAPRIVDEFIREKETRVMKRLEPRICLGCTIVAIAAGLAVTTAPAGDLSIDNLNVMKDARTFGVFSVIQGAAPTNRPILYFSFDQQASAGVILDESYHGNDGTLLGATWTNAGQYGGAYAFAGVSTQYLEVTGNSSLNLSTGITMAAWVYYLGEGQGNGFVFSKKYGNGLSYGISRYNSSYGGDGHKFVASMYAGSWGDYVGNYVLTNGVWYFLAATYDCQYLKMYVNGALVQTHSKSTPISGDSSGRLTVGADANAPTWNEFTHAMIDEVRLFNWALSETDIGALYSNTLSSVFSTGIVLRADDDGVRISADARIDHVVQQGDLSMGSYTNTP
jgi:hypothetical protein